MVSFCHVTPYFVDVFPSGNTSRSLAANGGASTYARRRNLGHLDHWYNDVLDGANVISITNGAGATAAPVVKVIKNPCRQVAAHVILTVDLFRASTSSAWTSVNLNVSVRPVRTVRIVSPPHA